MRDRTDSHQMILSYLLRLVFSDSCTEFSRWKHIFLWIGSWLIFLFHKKIMKKNSVHHFVLGFCMWIKFIQCKNSWLFFIFLFFAKAYICHITYAKNMRFHSWLAHLPTVVVAAVVRWQNEGSRDPSKRRVKRG